MRSTVFMPETGRQVVTTNSSSGTDDGSSMYSVRSESLNAGNGCRFGEDSVFMSNYRMYIGSMITPSGRLRETPASKKDAWRYAIDEYRKHKRELNMFDSRQMESMMVEDPSKSPDVPVQFDILINKIFDALEVKSRDYEICRYVSALLFNLDCIETLRDKTKGRVYNYLKTVNVKDLGHTDKQIGTALKYELRGGGQCDRLVSIKKRLVSRLSDIGVTKLDLGR